MPSPNAARPAATAAANMSFFIFRFLFWTARADARPPVFHQIFLWGAEPRNALMILRVAGVTCSLTSDVCRECRNLLYTSFLYLFRFPLAAHAVYQVFANLQRPIVGLIWSLNCRKCITLPECAQGGFEKKLKKVFGGFRPRFGDRATIPCFIGVSGNPPPSKRLGRSRGDLRH